MKLNIDVLQEIFIRLEKESLHSFSLTNRQFHLIFTRYEKELITTYLHYYISFLGMLNMFDHIPIDFLMENKKELMMKLTNDTKISFNCSLSTPHVCFSFNILETNINTFSFYLSEEHCKFRHSFERMSLFINGDNIKFYRTQIKKVNGTKNMNIKIIKFSSFAEFIIYFDKWTRKILENLCIDDKNRGRKLTLIIRKLLEYNYKENT